MTGKMVAAAVTQMIRMCFSVALGTPSGKIEIYSKTLEKFGYKDCPAHPTWLAPDEWKGTADEKQLQLLTAHPAHRLHSQLNYAELRK